MTKTKKGNNIAKIIIVSASSMIILLLLIWVGLSASAGYNIANPGREALDSAPDEVGLYFESIEIETNQRGILSGWFIPAQQKGEADPIPSDKTIITSHNYQSNREMIDISGLYFVRYLAEAGYNVVMFDYSGTGLSDGETTAFGCGEKEELLSVIDYVKSNYPESKIALHGWAFGAATAIMAGAESDVSAIIADSSYADLNRNLDEYIEIWSGLPELFNAPVRGFSELFSGHSFSESSPVGAVKNMKGKSIFFIHGKEDYVISYKDSDEMYNAAKENNKSELWIIDGCRHIYGFMEQENNYVTRVLEFLDSAMA